MLRCVDFRVVFVCFKTMSVSILISRQMSMMCLGRSCKCTCSYISW